MIVPASASPVSQAAEEETKAGEDTAEGGGARGREVCRQLRSADRELACFHGRRQSGELQERRRRGRGEGNMFEHHITALLQLSI